MPPTLRKISMLWQFSIPDSETQKKTSYRLKMKQLDVDICISDLQ